MKHGKERRAVILASPDERVKLLRAGITGKQIEKIFVELNHFKIVGAILYDPDAQPANLYRQFFFYVYQTVFQLHPLFQRKCLSNLMLKV